MLQIGDKWNGGTQSKEQVEAKLQSKQEAAMRRERALAYAYTHQVSHSYTEFVLYISTSLGCPGF